MLPGRETPPIDLKILVFVLAGVTVGHQTLFDEPWALADDQEASSVATFMAASQIVLWFGVLYFGRMIPYLRAEHGRARCRGQEVSAC